MNKQCELPRTPANKLLEPPLNFHPPSHDQSGHSLHPLHQYHRRRSRHRTHARSPTRRRHNPRLNCPPPPQILPLTPSGTPRRASTTTLRTLRQPWTPTTRGISRRTTSRQRLRRPTTTIRTIPLPTAATPARLPRAGLRPPTRFPSPSRPQRRCVPSAVVFEIAIANEVLFVTIAEPDAAPARRRREGLSESRVAAGWGTEEAESELFELFEL